MPENAKVPPETLQFDFWLGEWDVAWGDDQHGSNHIVRILDGAVIRENFDASPAMPFRGMRLSVYTPSVY